MNTRKPYLPRHLTLEERFWSNVDKRGEDECWLWTGSLNKVGYGQLTFKGVHWSAHKLAFTLLVGPIVHRDVCHRCDVRSCCNPKHLFNASHSVNMKDAVSKGRISQRILDKIEQGKKAKNEKCIRNEERERKKLLGPQLGPDGKWRDYMGRLCKPGQMIEERERDAFGRLVRKGAAPLPPRARGASGLFLSKEHAETSELSR